jgi:TPR repeat protein
MGGGPVTVAGKQLREALPYGDLLASGANGLPEYGVGLLCAAGSSEPAKAPADLPFTMFTGGVLELLRDGDPDAPEWLSLDFLQRLVQKKLRKQFADEAVLPQVHAPLQQVGRVDHVPLFPNPARRKRATERQTKFEPMAPSVQPATTTVASPLPPTGASPHTQESPVALGHKLERAGRYSEAALHYQLAADQGSALAQVLLGILYETGRGVRRSNSEAARLYSLAADQGSAAAQNNLGRLRETGSDLPQSFAEAARLYQLAAAQGHADAQSNLGYLYLTGRGVPQSDAEAARLYAEAARQGHTSSHTSLGFLHEQGRGVPQSYGEAARFYRVAAESGDASACYHLGRLYETGRGVRRSAADAMMWYRRGARHKHSDAEAALRRLEASG